MKPSHKADSVKSAPTHYSPSVPMSVYRELAAELRANKAVIDSLNSRNQQLIAQNQRLKKEIHNVVQATLNLGQFAGVARPAEQTELRQEFPSAIAPDTLAKLVRAQGEARKAVPSEPVDEFGLSQESLSRGSLSQGYMAQDSTAQDAIEMPAAVAPIPTSQVPTSQVPTSQAAPAPRRKPRPIQKTTVQKTTQTKSPDRSPAPRKSAAQSSVRSSAKAVPGKPKGKAVSKTSAGKGPNRAPATPRSNQREAITVQQKPLPKLFTEQAGEYRHSSLSSDEEKEIGGIWLALSIILIIVTAFGAGFLIMKPLLNDR